jgi:hypothetical protein
MSSGTTEMQLTGAVHPELHCTVVRTDVQGASSGFFSIMGKNDGWSHEVAVYMCMYNYDVLCKALFLTLQAISFIGRD